MSMKRSKPSTRGAARQNDSDFLFGRRPEIEPEKNWEEHVASRPEEEFVPYSLKSHFAKGALVAHSKFGKGLVISVEGTHVEVLFADGTKTLGHAPG